MIEDKKHRKLIPNLERLRAAWLKPSTSGLNEFFQALVKAAKESFDAKLATIWDNNVYADRLVFLGSEPSLKHSHYTIPKKSSYTGLAIERCELTPLEYSSDKIDERRFFNPSIIHEMHITNSISIPVPTPFNPQIVIFVINLYFDHAVSLTSKHRHALNDWVVRALGISLDYQLLQVDDMIRRTAESVSISASGRSGLFDGIYKELQHLTQCGSADLLLWDVKKKELTPERSLSASEIPKEHIDLMAKECIRKGQSIMIGINGDSPNNVLTDQKDSEWFAVMATPIPSTAGTPSGILHCSQKMGVEPKRSFSSLDMYVLESFARSIGPSVERFSRPPEKSVLMAVVEKVSAAAVQANNLDEILQCTIDTLTESLNAAVGSIFLLEDREGGSKRLIMRAATGVHKKFINQAEYKIGEGITGDIASGGGKLLNFKTLEERREYPTYIGQYNRENKIEEEYRGTPGFLGVPIERNGHVLGVWKIEFLKPSDIHPDPYFTDEDEQMARVLSSFLAYIIENDRYRKVKAQEFNLLEREFRLLAETSIALQTKDTEDDTILAMMVALERSDWRNALLSLYDPSTNQIVGRIGSGNWRGLADLTKRDINSSHVLAQVLRDGEPAFFPAASKNQGFDQNLVNMVKAKAIYVLPLRVGDELIGTLGVDMGTMTKMNEEAALLLRVSASHLSFAISRIRSINKSIAYSEVVMTRARFVVAEALSGVAVHSLNHTLDKILGSLSTDLNRQEIKGRKELKETLEKWQKQFQSGKKDLEKALGIVRASVDKIPMKPIDLHPLIQPSIDNWFALLSQKKCTVRHRLEAKWSHCTFPSHAFSEIISVLLVNSIQAFANEIEIRTYNLDAIDLPSDNYVAPAFCLEFSDDGTGVPTDNAEEIFEPTFTTKPDKFGTGLGLFIARTLALGEGGDLIVVLPNSRSKGATFRLVLPVEQVLSEQ